MRSILLICSLAYLLPSFSFAQPHPLVGTWQLISMKKQGPSGEWVDRCFSPTGLLTYTESGYMAVGINCMKEQNSNEPTSEVKDTIFYTGRYSIWGNEVTHRVVNSNDPIFYGSHLKRTFQFLGVGTVALQGNGKAGPVKMTWRKVTSTS